MNDNNEERRDQSMLHEVHTRLAVVEQYIKAREIYERDDRRYLRGLLIAFVIQVFALIGGAAYAAVEMGRWMQSIDSIDITELGRDQHTSLQILADHGTELETVRSEQFRMRQQMDDIVGELRNRTQDRFYKQDAIAMLARIKELEEDHQEYFYIKREYPSESRSYSQ